MLCDVNFMYRLFHDCARTLKRSLSVKLAIVELSGDFGFARNSSKHSCTLASFSHARMSCSACTRDVTCELYCRSLSLQQNVYLIFSKLGVTCIYAILGEFPKNNMIDSGLLSSRIYHESYDFLIKLRFHKQRL